MGIGLPMKEKMDSMTATRERKTAKPENSPVKVKLSRLAHDALLQGAAPDTAASARLRGAMRCYLSDRNAGQPAWPYPAFLRGSEAQEDVELDFDVGADLWLRFQAEASKQDVSPQQLLEHAAFYFAAELDAGRLTQRILDDLESAEARAEAAS
jgi:hypothetical protein